MQVTRQIRVHGRSPTVVPSRNRWCACIALEMAGGAVLMWRVRTPMMRVVMIHLLAQEGHDQAVVGAATPAAVASKGGRWSDQPDDYPT